MTFFSDLEKTTESHMKIHKRLQVAILNNKNKAGSNNARPRHITGQLIKSP